MRILAVHFVGNKRAKALPSSWEVIKVDTPILKTYQRLAKRAMKEGWDQSVIVVQDDVRFLHNPPKLYPEEELIVYGQTTRPDHICPRAFAASLFGWDLLRMAWDNPGSDSLCPTFTRVALQHGLILDVTKEIPDGTP